MALDANALLGMALPTRKVSFDEQDAIFYAIAVGAGTRGALQLVHEDNLRVLPSFGQHLTFDDSWMESAGVNLSKVVHGGLDLRFETPFPPSATVEVRPTIVGLGDKGEGKAATLLQQTEIILHGERICTSFSNLFIRGEGGFGGDCGVQLDGLQTPERAPDKIVEVATRADQALLFRLLGDLNPLHVLPAVARAAGFDRPILHGAATFGSACATILHEYCDDEPRRMARLAARFTGALYPGETSAFSFWNAEDGVYFSAHAKERGKPVLGGGKAEFRL
jgi:acyl dehydratase